MVLLLAPYQHLIERPVKVIEVRLAYHGLLLCPRRSVAHLACNSQCEVLNDPCQAHNEDGNMYTYVKGNVVGVPVGPFLKVR